MEQQQPVPNNEEPMIEDLTVTQGEAMEVKAGARVDYYIRIQTLDADITD